MAAKCRLVKWQRTKEIITKKKYSGESSPYGEWAQKHNKKEEGEFREFPETNPDVLIEQSEPDENLTRRIIKRDWRQIKFSKREKEVLVLLSQDMTPENVAKRLSITRRSVRVMIERIQKKGLKWFVAKRANSSTYSAEEEEE